MLLELYTREFADAIGKSYNAIGDKSKQWWRKVEE